NLQDGLKFTAFTAALQTITSISPESMFKISEKSARAGRHVGEKRRRAAVPGARPPFVRAFAREDRLQIQGFFTAIYRFLQDIAIEGAMERAHGGGLRRGEPFFWKSAARPSACDGAGDRKRS